MAECYAGLNPYPGTVLQCSRQHSTKGPVGGVSFPCQTGFRSAKAAGSTCAAFACLAKREEQEPANGTCEECNAASSNIIRRHVVDNSAGVGTKRPSALAVPRGRGHKQTAPKGDKHRRRLLAANETSRLMSLMARTYLARRVQ